MFRFEIFTFSGIGTLLGRGFVNANGLTATKSSVTI